MFARAWKSKAKDYRAAARFAAGVYRRREQRIRELRARIELAEKIIAQAAKWQAHDEELRELFLEWRSECSQNA